MISKLPAERSDSGRQPLVSSLRWATHVTHTLFITLALGTHSAYWQTGPFTWIPLLRVPAAVSVAVQVMARAGDTPAGEIGVLTLLPLALIAGWAWLYLLERRRGVHRRWRWGRPAIGLPLLGFTLLGLVSLATHPDLIGIKPAVALSLVWLLYLFILNERPRLTWPLALTVALQGCVAVGQFLYQRDLGLSVLGELTLDPTIPGTSVLTANGERWLRGYGLTGHPDLLAVLLAVLILMLLPALGTVQGWRRVGLLLTVTVGLLGLLATVSRGAWLGFGAGLAAWAGQAWHSKRHNPQGSMKRGRLPTWPTDVLLWLGILASSFFLRYRDLVLSRFLSLDSPLEARSLNERGRDISLAWQLIISHLWTGAGMGRYLPSARAVNPFALVVHNVPLLVMAELGVSGGLLWLWLLMAPFIRWRGSRLRWQWPAQAGAWIAFFVIGLFHSVPWITTSWRTATLFALLAATLSIRPKSHPSIGEAPGKWIDIAPRHKRRNSLTCGTTPGQDNGCSKR